ncbi:MAG: hypothetical protein JWN52_918 [Actinomycetia bacterium]|jgi:hypothetical protein|nr:hypothetical protein [Actinomycetes bacterium]
MWPQEQQWASRAAFRAWVRACHPDVGGDPEAFTAGLAGWRLRQVTPPEREAVQVSVFRSRGGWWLIARCWHRHRRRHVRRVL